MRARFLCVSRCSFLYQRTWWAENCGGSLRYCTARIASTVMLYCSVTRSNHSFEPSSVPARSTHFLITFLNRHNSWLRLSLFFIPVALYRHKSIVHTRCILLYPQHSASSCVYYQRHTFQLGEPSISHPKENAKVIFRIREVKGSNPSRSTFGSSVMVK